MSSFYDREELSSLGLGSFGENVLISRKSSLYGTENMHFGNNVRIDDFCFLSGSVILGNYVHIVAASMLYGSTAGIIMDDFTTLAQRVTVTADSDDYSGNSLTNPMTGSKFKTPKQQAVHIGRHVIVGAGCTVLPGVTIGEGCAIGAMSLVNKSTKPWTVNFGVPVREQGQRSKKLLELEKKFLEEEAQKNR